MKISVINGSLPNYDFGITTVNQIVVETLIELGEQVEIINLYEHNITFLQNDIPNGEIINILNKLQSSDGVIFSFNSHLFAPCGIMQHFLDFLSLPMCSTILKDKNCYVLSVSNQGGDRLSVDYMCSVINHLGGYPSVTTALTKDIAQNIMLVNDYKTLLEKQVEDFYRYVRQGRRFFTPKATVQMQQNFAPFVQMQQPAPAVQAQQPAYVPPVQQPPVSDQVLAQGFVPVQLAQSNDMPVNKQMQNMANSYAQNQRPAQQSNVNDLSSLNRFIGEPEPQQPQHINSQLSQSPQAQDLSSLGYVNATRADNYFNQDLNALQSNQVVSRSKTVEQMTKSLEHYFQGHLAKGVVMSLFIKVTGEEEFEGTLKINNNECKYIPGQNMTTDVTVIAGTKIWSDILSGKVSMQKSFMTGQIKVRGNFVLLSKFDSLFKL